MRFDKWLDTLVEEKGYDLEEYFDVEGPSGTNHMPYSMVFASFKHASEGEQQSIKEALILLDFNNADLLHFVRHLAQALAK